MTISIIIVWLILGALGGTLAGRLVTLSKEGLGHWTNMAVGMVGALVGGFIFWLFNINLGLGQIQVTGENVVSAFAGSLICIIAWWLYRKFRSPSKIEVK